MALKTRRRTVMILQSYRIRRDKIPWGTTLSQTQSLATTMGKPPKRDLNLHRSQDKMPSDNSTLYQPAQMTHRTTHTLRKDQVQNGDRYTMGQHQQQQEERKKQDTDHQNWRCLRIRWRMVPATTQSLSTTSQPTRSSTSTGLATSRKHSKSLNAVMESREMTQKVNNSN